MKKYNLPKWVTPRSCEEWIKDTTLLLFVCLFSSLYFLFNTSHGAVLIPSIALDYQIPRIPVFVILYIFYLPWLWGVVFYSWLSRQYFYQFAYSIIIIKIIAFSIFFTFQTYMPRDPIISNDFFSCILQMLYDHDQPYNCLPSLHAALSSSIAVYFIFRKSRWSQLSVILAILIIASTLFIKQHFIADAVTGIILGSIVTWAVFYFYPKRKTLAN